ncbi:hypothetical protein BP5796_11723 [Coleophoma crateriformis]|uniref:Uncharacterized protein n=1 Tax=Coleophoma crateriformis TaxID=565419 RepID=A0A3D8QEF9_9HELO|nr:hypothetical protein BP5796_11723 [Coleophoma crateriformis]
MCLIRAPPRQVKDLKRSKNFKPKPPAINTPVPQHILDAKNNMAIRIVPLPANVKMDKINGDTRNKPGVNFTSAKFGPQAFVFQAPLNATELCAGLHWHPQPPATQAPQKKEEVSRSGGRRRSSVFQDIEFLKRLHEGLESLAGGDKKKAKEKEDGKGKVDESTPTIKTLQDDIRALKDNLALKEFEEELRIIKAVGFADGKAAAEKAMKENERQRAHETKKPQERRRSWSRVSRREPAWNNDGSYWHYHSHHANPIPSVREQGRGAEFELEYLTGYADLGVGDGRLGSAFSERRRSSLSEVIPTISRRVHERLARRDREAELEHERERGLCGERGRDSRIGGRTWYH